MVATRKMVDSQILIYLYAISPMQLMKLREYKKMSTKKDNGEKAKVRASRTAGIKLFYEIANKSMRIPEKYSIPQNDINTMISICTKARAKWETENKPIKLSDLPEAERKKIQVARLEKRLAKLKGGA